MLERILFETKNIFKTFGPTKALTDVSVQIKPGEILGLIGENGSGKSTLSSIISAVYKPDKGEMIMNQEAFRPKDTIDANQKGVSIVVQEQGTFEKLTVAGNLFIGQESLFSKKGVLSVSKMNAAARQILDDIGISHINEKKLTGSLSFEDRKLIEIARAMYFNPNILIVDETTTALSQTGRDILYRIILQLKKVEKSVIFISHDIKEVMEYCDRVTVLRDGQYIDTVKRADFSEGAIKSLMVGREISGHYYRADYKATRLDRLALQLQNVVTERLDNVSLELYRGEIMGIGGLTECGMHELGKVAFGLIQPDVGKVFYGENEHIHNSKTAMKHKIGYLSKDRDQESLMKTASIRDNICLPSLKFLGKAGIISKKTEKKFSEKWADCMNVKMNNVNDYISSLSGGNKQKVVLAKWLGFGSEVLILDCPTRGIDVGVKQTIYQLLVQLKNEGKAIMMISEELAELIGMSDRVIIMKNGKVSGEFSRGEGLSETKLIQYML